MRFASFSRMLAALTIFTVTLSCRGFAKELIVIESENLKCNDSVLVFTPRAENGLEIEPVANLFLFHGWGGCYSNWSDKYDLQQISDRLNFPNASFFGKYFKRYMGIKPLDYRHA